MITQYRPSHYQAPRAPSFTGRSIDDKPLHVENGATFNELDTGRTFRYDAENNKWVEQETSTPVKPGKPEQTKTVDLAMATGNQIISPDDGKTLSSVTVNKPTTMIPTNIKTGVNIGGVIGTLLPAKEEQAKTTALVMGSGDQTVTPDTGKVLSSVKITKPATLIPANIKTGVDIGGVKGTLAPAKTEQTKTADLSMAEGNQIISADTGKVMTTVTVNKPETLIPANIKAGVNIGGVVGTASGAKEEQTKTVELSMASGNQTINPDSGKVLSSVVITKPATLIADNIKSGTVIGGVTGTLTPAKEEQNKTVDLAMSTGDQIVSPDAGKALSSVKITKPTTLVATNIRTGVDIGGVTGTLAPAKSEQAKTATLDMTSGDQVISADAGKVMTGVTITKPDTFVAENIKDGVDIGGVTGTLMPRKTEQAKTVDLSMATGNQTISPDSGKVLSSVVVTKPATLVAGNIKSDIIIGGVKGNLIPAKDEQSKTIDLVLSTGDQVVQPDIGKVLSSVVISKPETLVASNIKSGIAIAGVTGTLSPAKAEETKTVDLSMASGDQTITPTTGKVMTSVKVTKPTTMISANIKKGVTIGGVVGTYDNAPTTPYTTETYNADGALTSATLYGYTAVRDNMFYSCASLATVTFKNTPTSISATAFVGCDALTVISVPWAEGAVEGAPWGATNATITYNYTE